MTFARFALGVPLVLAVAMGAPSVLAQAQTQPSATPEAPAQAPTRVLDDAPLTAEAVRIRHLLDAGQTAEAAAAARAFARRVTDEAGFGVTNVRLTETPATGFGVFEPRDNHVYTIDEPVFAYVELYGFSLTPQPNGGNALVFDVSFTLDTPDGRQMTEDLVPMGEIRLTSHSDPLDAYFHLTYSITGAEGAFALRTRVVDRASGETAEFTFPVEFRAEPPTGPAPGADDDKLR